MDKFCKFDKGPFYQSERTHRYKSVVESLLEKGLAYFCYCSNEELDQMRELQKKRGEKPRYNGLWRPENIAKQKMTIPKNIKPVVRFKNPDSGFISWNDQVKGKISINNSMGILNSKCKNIIYEIYLFVNLDRNLENVILKFR